MSAAHTPGRLAHDQRGYPYADLRSESGRGVAHTWGACSSQPKSAENYKRRTDEDRANARRLAACWNACEQLSTEQLEQVPSLPLAMVAHHELLAQRDKLLGAGQEALAGLAEMAVALATGEAATPEQIARVIAMAKPESPMGKLRAAIAKATGSAA